MSNSPFCLSTHAQKRWPSHLLLMAFLIISMTQLSTYHFKKLHHIYLLLDDVMKYQWVNECINSIYQFGENVLHIPNTLFTQISLKLVGNEIKLY